MSAVNLNNLKMGVHKNVTRGWLGLEETKESHTASSYNCTKQERQSEN